MAVICWGNLGKTASDNTRIEQSMQDYVENHNENPNAHQIEGSSLYMHRINEHIDHLDGSISLRKLMMDKVIIISNFESLDGWQKNGIVSASVGYLIVYGRFSQVALAEAFFGVSGSLASFDVTKETFMQTTVRVPYTTNQVIYFGLGYCIEAFDGGYAGFKVVNNTLYATWGDETRTNTYQLSGITLSNNNVYRINYVPAESKIEFFINGVLKHTNTNLTQIRNNDVMGCFQAKSTVSGDKYLEAYDLLVEKAK